MARYRGFSTIGRYKKFRAVDVDLIKQDLLNHFNIRRGEKLMNPTFGTIIWNCLFEPFTPEIRQTIIDDVARIVNYDPRTNAINVIVDEYDLGLQIEIELEYVGANKQDSLVVMFDRDAGLAQQS
jgi:phage baseplate assembly protein W